MLLTRETRTWLGGETPTHLESVRNSWAGSCDGDNFDRFTIVRITVSGDPDPQTGYVCDIRHLDRLAQSVVCERLEAVANSGQSSLPAMASALTSAFPVVEENAPQGTRLESIDSLLSPYTSFTIQHGDPMMLRLTQSFEFSASHRLAIPTLSDSENTALFGKCSNPEGHGHNYVFEVTVAGEAGRPNGTLTDIGSIDRIVREVVVEAFDHKNLNTQCPEFSDLNPTVENIASVIFSRLLGKFDACDLDRVRVWETPKTSAEVTRDNHRP